MQSLVQFSSFWQRSWKVRFGWLLTMLMFGWSLVLTQFHFGATMYKKILESFSLHSSPQKYEVYAWWNGLMKYILQIVKKWKKQKYVDYHILKIFHLGNVIKYNFLGCIIFDNYPRYQHNRDTEIVIGSRSSFLRIVIGS